MKLLKLLLITILSCTQVDSMDNASANQQPIKRPRNECAYFYAGLFRKIKEEEHQQRIAERDQLLVQHTPIISPALPAILIPRSSIYPEIRKNAKG